MTIDVDRGNLRSDTPEEGAGVLKTLADMRAAGELSTAAQLASVLIVGMNLYGYLLRQIHH
jgi:hypothetical protein